MTLFGSPRPPAWPPPAFLTRPRNWALVLILIVVPFLVPVPRVLRYDLVISTLGDRMHVVLLAAMTLALYWRGPVAGRPLVAAVTATLAGGLIELVQILVGRAALWHDVWLDLMGVTVALGLITWRGHGRRGGLVLMALALGVVVFEMRELPGQKRAADEMRNRFPVLANFEGPRALTLWNDRLGADPLIVPGALGPLLRMTGDPADPWPSLTLTRFPHDWSAFDSLKVDVRAVLDPGDTVRVGLRVDDHEGRDDGAWLSRSYRVANTWRTLALPLHEQTTFFDERLFENDDVFALAIFMIHPADTLVLEIDDVRLE